MSKDFTREQEERIDEVLQKVEDLIRYLAPANLNPEKNHPELVRVGQVADMIAEYLTDRGHKVYFPIHIIDGDYEEISDIWK